MNWNNNTDAFNITEHNRKLQYNGYGENKKASFSSVLMLTLCKGCSVCGGNSTAEHVQKQVPRTVRTMRKHETCQE